MSSDVNEQERVDHDALASELREAFGFDGSGSAGVLLGDSPMLRWAHAGSSGGPIPAQQTTLAIGSRLADFEVLGELGRGGMGVVYRARQLSLDREVALKVLPEYARHGRSAIQRFRTEAQAAARLNHTNVVPIYAQGEHEGHYYYAMKLVEGVSLDTAIRSQPELLSSTHAGRTSRLAKSKSKSTTPEPKTGTERDRAEDEPATCEPPKRTMEDYRYIASLIAGAADGLAHAHEHGVVHRDIKPRNLILGGDHRLHITDFGLALLTDEPHLTVTGEVMGTPCYLSPEQARGEVGSIDHRTDVFSMGVTLYELITTERPFDGESREAVLEAVRHAEPKHPRRIDPRIPRDLDTICMKALEKEPDRRFATAMTLAEDLRRFADGRPIRARRVGALGRAAKWVRRHKLATAAMIGVLFTMVASTGWVWTARIAHVRGVQARRARIAEAGETLEQAYRTIVHSRLKARPGAIGRAQRMGVDPARISFVQAVEAAGEKNFDVCEALLLPVLSADPDHVEALYLLAWAQWRLGNVEGYRKTLARADALRGPQTPEEWHFRGNAVVRDDPDDAVRCQRKAIELARQKFFFAAAMLELAQAVNQQMYSKRVANNFDEAASTLKVLIQNGSYGGYPYYLLSIAHRLAGEIYEAGSEVRVDGIAQRHFEAALKVAREGQLAAPDTTEPIKAEAEALEHMGRFDQALVVRDRGLELARRQGRDEEAVENLHFRWRLHYWLGHNSAAAADLAVLQAARPENIYYAHGYPALIQAATGDLAAAREELRTLAHDRYTNPGAVFLAAGLLRVLGNEDDAVAILRTYRSRVDFGTGGETEGVQRWIHALYDYAVDEKGFRVLEDLARELERPWMQMCHAYFQRAAKSLANGDRRGARADFRRSYRTFRGVWGCQFLAHAILVKMDSDPEWPYWIETTGGYDNGAQ